MIVAVDVVALWGLCAYGSRENSPHNTAINERRMNNSRIVGNLLNRPMRIPVGIRKAFRQMPASHGIDGNSPSEG
jgi:hypothetical protein